MTDETPRCEPPPEWRDRDGWHWLATEDGDYLMARWCDIHRSTGWGWRAEGSVAFSVIGATNQRWTYHSPVTPPAAAAAMAKALEGLETHAGHLAVLLDAASGVDFRDDAAIYAARAALAAYRGEAGR